MKYYRVDSANMLLSALYIKPTLFDTPEMASLSENDFPNKLHKVAYSIMFNLYSMGHIKFSEGVIQSYLLGRPQLAEFFNKPDATGAPQGRQYFENLAQHGDPTVFSPSFNMVKKMTLLRNLDAHGVNVSQFFDWDAKDKEVLDHQLHWLETTSIKDIAGEIGDSIDRVMNIATNGSTTRSIQAGDGLGELLARFQEAPDYGLPSSVPMKDSITRGNRFGKFYLFSAPTGGGKSRLMMADAVYSAVPYIYNHKKKEWEETGAPPQGALFISTELDEEECQTMALAFLTGIQEEVILDGKYSPEEYDILQKGIEIMKESPLYFEIISDFSIYEIEAMIRKYYREHDVNLIFFDYIHTSMQLLNEIATISNGMKVREDQILFMLATRLKELANNLGIFIQSATQLNGDYQEGELNQNLLRGQQFRATKILIQFIIGVYTRLKYRLTGKPKRKVVGNPVSYLIFTFHSI